MRRVTWCLALVATLVATLGATLGAGAQNPRYGGTLVMGLGGEPRHLNPGITPDNYVLIPTSPIYNQLVNLDNSVKPVPDLARTWTVADGGKTYTFRLARDVRWHDGAPFSSADVKFTFETILREHHGLGRVVLASLDRIETPDADTVVFRLKYPYEALLTYAGSGNARILPKHLLEGLDPRTAPFNLKPVGTGPFRLAEWVKGSHLAVERNPAYFKKGEPYLDRIIFKFVPTSASRVIALESGEIDYVAYYDLPASEVARLRQSPNLVVTGKGHSQNASIMQLIFNHDRPIFKSLKVRQAIAHAIDKNFLLQKADYGLGRAATGPIASEFQWCYNPNVRSYDYDPSKAEALLDEAGYKRGADGVRFRAELIANRGDDIFVSSAEIVTQQLKRVGIELTPRIMDRAALLNDVYTRRQFDMLLHGFATGPDPDVGVARLYVSSNIRPAAFTNGAGYRNEQVDRLFALGARAATRDERAQIYRKVQELLVDEVPHVWLLEYSRTSAFRKEFENLHTWSPASYLQFAGAWWVKGRPTP